MSWRLPKRPGFNERIVENPSERRCSLLYSSKAATEAHRQGDKQAAKAGTGRMLFSSGLARHGGHMGIEGGKFEPESEAKTRTLPRSKGCDTRRTSDKPRV